MSIPARTVWALLLILVSALPATAQRGAITRPQDLGELVDEAAVIVRGQISSAHVESHPQWKHLRTVVVTLRVQETLKGESGATYTFRQFIWDPRDRLDAASYTKGQRVLLLLTAPNQNGLSSPVGLEQGRFRILRDKDGQEYAINGHGNAGLFRNVAQQAARKGVELSPQQARMMAEHSSGPVSVESLGEMIRQLSGRK